MLYEWDRGLCILPFKVKTAPVDLIVVTIALQYCIAYYILFFSEIIKFLCVIKLADLLSL